MEKQLLLFNDKLYYFYKYVERYKYLKEKLGTKKTRSLYMKLKEIIKSDTVLRFYIKK